MSSVWKAGAWRAAGLDLPDMHVSRPTVGWELGARAIVLQALEFTTQVIALQGIIAFKEAIQAPKTCVQQASCLGLVPNSAFKQHRTPQRPSGKRTEATH